MALTVIDAGVVIGTLDADDPHHRSAVEVLRIRLDRGDELVVPASVYAEILVGPFRRGGGAVAEADAFFADTGIHIHPVARAIARSAARLRAGSGGRVRLPDALVIATAEALEAECITTDKRWPPDLPVTVELLWNAGAESVPPQRGHERHR